VDAKLRFFLDRESWIASHLPRRKRFPSACMSIAAKARPANHRNGIARSFAPAVHIMLKCVLNVIYIDLFAITVNGLTTSTMQQSS
jgi:hypothetical protein